VLAKQALLVTVVAAVAVQPPRPPSPPHRAEVGRARPSHPRGRGPPSGGGSGGGRRALEHPSRERPAGGAGRDASDRD
jgi:hypothetical protein